MTVCIGGKCDGQSFYMPMAMSAKEVITVQKDVGPIATGNCVYGEMPENADLYRPTEYRWKSQSVWMLVHVSLDPAQAINILLSAYNR